MKRSTFKKLKMQHYQFMNPSMSKSELEIKTRYRLIFNEKDTEIKNGKVYIKQTEKELTDLTKQLSEELELDI